MPYNNKRDKHYKETETLKRKGTRKYQERVTEEKESKQEIKRYTMIPIKKSLYHRED